MEWSGMRVKRQEEERGEAFDMQHTSAIGGPKQGIGMR